ncbi:uncharacterized protein LOC123263369 isoform X2 [Cotesia glomerata]|uniref:uncharacterized protein LOC123263369 isoform X2 n=1 Tax=Cotesia glomerata TaxID=32391 RepID=UPI001D022DE6|nr:uncharacterized protein LOC123263369 isoform X2 [Cotesia glomerata]
MYFLANTMDEETHHYDLRSRSRSRSHTPMVFNQNLIDFNTYDHRFLRDRGSKERSQTPVEVSSSRRSESRSLPRSTLKNDTIKEEIQQNIEDIQKAQVTVEYERQNEKSALSTVKKIDKRSERRRVRRQDNVHGQGELKESKSIKISSKSLSPNKIITSDYSSDEGKFHDSSRSPRSAYEIYKQVGDWWDVFPKTDYTYSPTSRCRYEIAPGILAMPNMSRTSIHLACGSNCSSLIYSQQNSTLSQRNKTRSFNYLDKDITDAVNQNRLNEEQHFYSFAYDTTRQSDLHTYNQTQIDKSRNLDTSSYAESENRFNSSSHINFNTELSEALQLNTNNNKKWTILWFEKIKNVLTLLFINLFQFVGIKMLKKNSTTSHNYWQYQESTLTKIWKKMYRVFQYSYLLLMKTLFFDSWILRCVSTFSKSLRKYSSKWIIFILPLLLFLLGYWFYPYGENLGFPSFSRTDFSQFSTTKKSLTPINPIEPLEKNFFIINDAIQEKISQQIISLIDRVEKLEAIEKNSEKNILNLNQSHAKLKVDEAKVWKLYEKKISDLEDRVINAQHILEYQNIEKRNTYDEIQNIKTELNNIQSLYANLKTCCDKSISPKEINEIFTNLLISSDNYNKKSGGEDLKTLKCEHLPNTSSLSEEHIKNIVKEILKTYNADKTGKVDYALESAGGQIISIRCTQSYSVNTRAFKVLGFILYYESSDPRTVIQGHSLQPGVCWAFQDFPGYLVIKLRSPIQITGFTVEHAPKSILPNNEIKSAPKKFNIWGLKEENDSDPVLFGEYEFLDNDESLQYFPVQNLNVVEPYEFIELKIHSNHGQLDYTCLYRFRVHGRLI